MKIIKKQNVFGWISLAAAVLTLVGLIIYIVSSVTGYMAGKSVNAIPIVFSIIALVILIGAPLMAEKIDGRIIQAAMIVAVVMIAVSLCVFINARLNLFADVYFIPVNYPAKEGSSLNVAIVGMVFYIIALVASIVCGFAGSLVKKSAETEKA